MNLAQILDKKAILMLFVAGLGASGCLVAEPVDVDEPTRVAPFMITEQAVPTTFRIYPTRATRDPIPFTVPFTSEDYGEDVVGKLYLNYDSEERVRGIGSQQVNGTSGKRDMTVEWALPEDYEPGCYSITMVISHEDNFPQDHLQKPINNDLAAFVTWWVAHDLQLHELTLFDCPNGAPGSSLQ